MRDVAEKSRDLGLSLEPHDVKIISEIVNMMGREKSSSDMEIAAIMTRYLFANFLWQLGLKKNTFEFQKKKNYSFKIIILRY